jgi:hypothetical protein
MNIKSTKYFFVSLLTLLISWRLIITALVTFDVLTEDNVVFVNYAGILLIICLTMLTIFFLNNYSDIISQSQWLEGEIILKKRGVFNSFNRAEHYNFSYKTYFKLLDKNGTEHRLIGMFLEEDAINEQEEYQIKVRNKRIIDYKKIESS